MDIVFLLGMASHARYWKRIEALRELGVRATVLAFERTHYRGRELPDYCTVLGHTAHGHYFRRVIPLAKALHIVRDRVRHADAMYAFDMDMAMMALLASVGLPVRKNLVYEIGDIRGVKLQSGFAGKIVRAIERQVLTRVRRLVVTSEDYVTGYYKDVLGFESVPYSVIENKIDLQQMNSILKSSEPGRPKNDDGAVTIGYFGVLRCSRSWEILKKIALRSNGKVQILLRGVPMGLHKFEEQIRQIPGMRYEGPYVSPDELADMYNQVDVVWACYPYQGETVGNWCWARTTRFYESCFFRKPMIAQKGTADARVVEAFGVGTTVDLANVEESVAHVCAMRKSELGNWTSNFKHVPESVYVYTDEHEQLLRNITPK